MNIKHLILAVTLLTLSACNSQPHQPSTQKQGNQNTSINNHRPGSLANKNLITDVMQDIQSAIFAESECRKIDRTQPYILKAAAGENGSKKWEENWIVRACGSTHDFVILFSQSIMGGVRYVILKKPKAKK